MSQLTNLGENRVIDALLRGQALGAPATWHIGLLTAAADQEVPTLTEVTGGSYARVAVTASLANFSGTQGAGTTTASSGTSGASSNNIAITFAAPTANWGTITHMAFFDASSGGNAWIVLPLAQSRIVNNGDAAPSFAINTLTVTAA